MKNIRIHITGASGSGTTTLGIALAKKYGIKHFDTDYFYWEKTTVPFAKKRDRGEAAKLLKKTLKKMIHGLSLVHFVSGVILQLNISI